MYDEPLMRICRVEIDARMERHVYMCVRARPRMFVVCASSLRTPERPGSSTMCTDRCVNFNGNGLSCNNGITNYFSNVWLSLH